MEYINQIYTFLFIFCLLAVFRTVTNFFVSIFSNPPKKIEYTDKETILIGVFLSYIITYLIFL